MYLDLLHFDILMYPRLHPIQDVPAMSTTFTNFGFTNFTGALKDFLGGFFLVENVVFSMGDAFVGTNDVGVGGQVPTDFFLDDVSAWLLSS